MRAVLCGCSGKMGRAVAALAPEFGAEIVCGVDDVPAPLPFPVYRSFKETSEQADVVLDFSSPRRLSERLEFCLERNIGIVIATTGFGTADLDLIDRASERVPIFRSANFSLGICVLNRLAKQAAALLREFDVEIVERHHAQKKDAPSGTALALAESVQEIRGGKITSSRSGMRQKDEIGVHSVRGGGIFGEHEICFLGADETVVLGHSALGRETFAAGALKAARFLLSRPAGLYGMDDLIS